MMKKVRDKISDFVARFVASWKFIFLYSASMILWIILHSYGFLSIDSLEFVKFSLFLSWLAGIQASIILMASNRQSEKDREMVRRGVELDENILCFDQSASKKTMDKLNKIMSKMSKLEKIITLMEEDDQ